MTRNRASAKAAGRRFEKDVADYLGGERRRLEGANDRGDIAGVTAGEYPVIVECKNTTQMRLPQWWKETQKEAAAECKHSETGYTFGVIAHKRHGKAGAEDQWVTMDLGELRSILNYINELYERVQATEKERDTLAALLKEQA